MAPTIGIDFGLAVSKVGIYRDGFKLIDTVPSTVSIKGTTISNIRRILGQRYEDVKSYDYVQKTSNPDRSQLVVGGETFAPEKIAAMILVKLKESAEKHLKSSVTKAVISVPAEFGQSQRLAVKNAARIAGLDSVLLNATSAGLCAADKGNILVIDASDGIELAVGEVDELVEPKACIKATKPTLSENIDEVLSAAGVNKSSIQQVILTGERLQVPLKNVKFVEEAIVLGVSMQASKLDAEDFLVFEIITRTVGRESPIEQMDRVIDRYASIPFRQNRSETTYADNQPGIMIRAFEGERNFVVDDRLIFRAHIEGIPKAARGVPKIEVTFNVDQDGIPKVTSYEANTKKELTVIYEMIGALTEDEIKNMLK